MRTFLLTRFTSATCLMLGLLTGLSAVAAEFPAHYIYRGSLTHFPDNKQDRGQEVKRFQIDAFVDQAVNDEVIMNYVISENGSGGWHWSQQFGALTYNSAQNAQSGREWMLLNSYDDKEYEVAFRAPWFEQLDRLKENAAWEELPFEYTVAKNAQDSSSWSVKMKHNLSRHQELTVKGESGLVTAARQTVFVGQGDRFQLDWKLEEQLPLEENAWTAISKIWSSLANLQRDLKVDLYIPVEELNKDQLDLTRAQLTALKTESANTPLESLVRKIELQTELGEERADSMAALSEKFVGKEPPEFQLVTLKNANIDKADYAGKPVILHFWRYQDQSLKAPYGQTGYLDYLYNQREKEGIKVYGIAVDPRLSDPQQKRSAMLQIKKTTRFMNLSYPITLDDGELLQKFGNPQISAGQLPLWVVLGPDGKVAHYFAGHYEVKPNEGLKELDALVADLLTQATAE
ncbi:Thiol-disulfide oxidoreductase ResA [Polystyrenella longa]|uniref:Thiol-disulfide oxidoreductase ResA n=1 Tax=Polystyrenella longa TaxID=2528007 RepID=A0A518CM66_9PLAN|nr:TlpA disulfide reductase family protein [Polystyrenella longa]QDU80312.1 Thiol-disulfide oxidoreductase ResA [Polystyrenella longa]